MNNFKLSVIVPILNEERVLGEFFKRLENALITTCKNYEVIFIDDGSMDSSLDILKGFTKRNINIKIVSLSRNFGHQIALTVGLKFSSGDTAIMMDADLQDPPEIIPKFIEKWKEGYKIVYGIRKEREEGILKKLAYKLFYRFLRIMSKTNIPLDSGDFSLIDRRIIDLLNSMPEKARFLRGLRSWMGFKQIGVEYNRDRRYAGKPKYTLTKLFKLAFSGLISFSEFPLILISVIGTLIAIASLGYGTYIVLKRIMSGGTVIGWHTIVASITFLGGVQLLILGLIGAYITKIFDEIKQRPLFIIDQIIGFEDNKVNIISNYHMSTNLHPLQPESY